MIPAPIPWPEIRSRLAAAVAEAVADNQWVASKYIPLNPDPPTFWIDWPDMDRSSLAGHYRYDVAVVFAVGLFDTDVELAQSALDEVYVDEFYDRLTAAAAARDLDVVASPPDRPQQLELPTGAFLLAAEVHLDFTA